MTKLDALPAPEGYYHDGISALRCLTCFHLYPCPEHDERTPTMRFFDDDKVGCYLDDIGHRVEKTDGKEIKMVDLTLRVQPLTAELAAALDPDVRALLFTMGDAMPKSKLAAIHFNLPAENQDLTVQLIPESDEGAIHILDVEISKPRARVEKGVDGFGFVFYASFGPVGRDELEYLVGWHTQQRFITFHPHEPALNFKGAEPLDDETPAPSRRRPRAVPPPQEARA